jgi:hypothetical protein
MVRGAAPAALWGLVVGFALCGAPAAGVASRAAAQEALSAGAASSSAVAVTLQAGQLNCTACSLEAVDVQGNVVYSATVSSGSNGGFSLSVPMAASPLYVRVSAGGSADALAVVYGASSVSISALSTAASAYVLSYPLSRSSSSELSGLGAGYALSASGMYGNLVSATTGAISSVLTASPNADQTTGQRALNSLGNLVLAAFSNATLRASLLRLTAVGGVQPATVSAALANMARNPSLNVAAIFALIPSAAAPLYAPSFASAPQSWMLACKINDSGSTKTGEMYAGPGKVVFEAATGNAWLTNNVIQGQPYSTNYGAFALLPSGRPQAFSPLGNAGILGAGFGITFGTGPSAGQVFVGNFGWGPNPSCKYYPGLPPCSGSVSAVTLAGQAMPGSPFQDGPVNAQGMNMDADSNLWISSYGSDSVWVFPGGNAAKSFGYTLYNGSQPFDLHFFEGKAWVACGGGISGADANSSLTQFEIQGSELVLLQQVWFGQAIKGFDIDAQGNMWVASQGDSLIYKVNQQGQVVGKFNGGGLNGPWSATVDGDGNVYVATVMAMAIPSDFQNTISVHARMCPAG